MNIKRKTILSVLGISLSLQLAFAQGNGEVDFYNKAYSEITDMLDGRNPLSVRGAVFLAEWAYLDGNLDYERDFCEPIKKGANYLRRMIAVNHWEKYKTAVFLNAWEPTRIQTKMENNRIDATFTNDPVQILSTPLFGKPDIPASDDKIRIRCDESLMYIHRNFIDQNSNKLWHLINDFLSK